MNRIAAIILIASLGLAGCTASAPPPTTTTVRPPGSIELPAPSSNVATAKSVAAAEQSLTLAMQTATIYTDLPRCGSAGATVVCSDRDIVRQIRLAAIKAHNLMVKARKNEALLGGALNAIDALSNIIPGR